MSSRTSSRVAVVSALATAILITASGAPGRPLGDAPACPIFPPDSAWNQRIDDLPVHNRSDAIIRTIGRAEGVHADFGSGTWEGGPIGIPFTTVGSEQPRVPVTFHYDDESDPGPYPIPPGAPVEGGPDATGDRHVIVVDRDVCRLYELFDAHPVDGGQAWTAGSGATWDLGSNALRPKGWTSADAAGLPILPGLARFEELAAGGIDHALRITVSRTRRHYIYPARHFASSRTDRNLPAMGQRFRLKRGFDIGTFSPQSQVVLRALKRYGAIVADNGSDMFVSGAPSEGWDNDDLHELGRVTANDFVVVDSSALRPTS